MSFALSGPPVPWQIWFNGFAVQNAVAAPVAVRIDCAKNVLDPLQVALRLVLQVDARMALVSVLLSAEVRNGLSRRMRSRKSKVPVELMNPGPALLPLVWRRTHLASTNGWKA